MKIIMAGATGLIGLPLAQALQEAGHEVAVLTRRLDRAVSSSPRGVRAIQWDARSHEATWTDEVRGAQAVINLAGANIGEKRWTAEQKRQILQSRLDATEAITGLIESLPPEQRPQVLVNASGLDFYGDRGDEVITESSGPGSGFLASVCRQWEMAAQRAEPLGVRVVLMRTAVVLANEASALKRLVLPFRFFVGGPLGNGRQWFCWIHLDDVIGMYRFAVEQAAASGPLNAVAPDARPERDVARAIGRLLGRPSWAPVPAFALKLALGEQSELVLHGRHAQPQKAQSLGYRFRYPQLEAALAQALSRDA